LKKSDGKIVDIALNIDIFGGISKSPKIMRSFLVIILLSICFSSCNIQENPFEQPIKVDGGLISGSLNPTSSVYSFKGIPFAQPPVGELRWKSPKPVQPWEGIKECVTFGPSPFQNPPASFMFWPLEYQIPSEPIGEDCLYLNVWTKAETIEDKRPVLVYIYGGGFSSGGSGCAIYDGDAMASKDIVFVSINYRVGTFGFFAHPELSEESEFGTSGNYALLDMISALHWVKNNIAAFGGDPDNVTIAGQSAGAFAVNLLVASPYGKGLFHRAIAESGGSIYSNPNRPQTALKRAEELGVEFASQIGCSSLEELRNKSAQEIHDAGGNLRRPIIDGSIIPESVYNIFKQGRQNDVPLLAGWNKDDVVIMDVQPADSFRNQMANNFKDLSTSFFEAYPCSTEEETKQSQLDYNRDVIFGSQVYSWAKIQTETGEAPAFVYNFHRELPAYSDETDFGAFHSGEIVYAYNNLHTSDRPWREIDHKIADLLSDYWVNFTKNGDPNGENLPKWKPFDPTKNEVMIIDSISNFDVLPTLNKMQFWERYFNYIPNI
jgi:para-nitrobenzyl esterase